MKLINMFAAICLATLPFAGSAQEDQGFDPVNINEEFMENPFTYFSAAPILASGTASGYDAMTINWGALGNVWGDKRPSVTVYVSPKHYTHDFMEKSKYFTIMTFDDPKIAKYMGTHSGRDGDKAKALKLHVAYTKNGTPYFKEANFVMECETMYGAPIVESGFRNDAPRQAYSKIAAGLSTMYIGQVVGAWTKVPVGDEAPAEVDSVQ